jgi:hypothetical protein
MRLVILESPYAGDVDRNVAYARAALADSLRRGEAPIASHLLYTQPGVLDDDVPDERRLGIDAGLAWGRVADAAVFYVDLGMSRGMLQAWDRHHLEGRPVERRRLVTAGWFGDYIGPFPANDAHMQACGQVGAVAGVPVVVNPTIPPQAMQLRQPNVVVIEAADSSLHGQGTVIASAMLGARRKPRICGCRGGIGHERAAHYLAGPQCPGDAIHSAARRAVADRAAGRRCRMGGYANARLAAV